MPINTENTILDLGQKITPASLRDMQRIQNYITQLNNLAFTEISSLANDIAYAMEGNPYITSPKEISDELTIVKAILDGLDVDFIGNYNISDETMLLFEVNSWTNLPDDPMHCGIFYEDLFDEKRRAQLIARLIDEIKSL